MGRAAQLRLGPVRPSGRSAEHLCGDSVVSRRLRRRAGRAAAVARRLRARARPGGRAGEARAARRRPVADAAGVEAARRARTRDGEGGAARAARRVGPRPPVVAGPDGAHAGAAGRADDARLARLVRDLEVGRAAEADAAPERAAAPARARATSSSSRSTSRATRRCCCGSTARPTTAGTSTRTTRASCRSCSASAPAAATPSATCAQLARALTGFRNDWTDAGPTRFRYDKKCHDAGAKRIYGRRGKYGWQEGVRLVTRHRRHPEFMVAKLWGYFIPTKPPAGDGEGAGAAVRRAAAATCARCWRRSSPTRTSTTRARGWSSRRSCRPPGCCAPSAAGSTRPAWAWLCDGAGQYLFLPPNVSGWDDTRWLDTATFRARWQMAQYICDPARLDPEKVTDVPPTPPSWSAARPRSGARRRSPARCAPASSATPPTRWPPPTSPGSRPSYPVLALNALRMLVATSPRLPDELIMELLHRTRPRVRGPPRDRGRACPSPPAPASRAARSCCAPPGSGSRSTAPGSSRSCRRSRPASRRRRPRPPAPCC